MQENRLRELWQAAGFDSLAEMARRAGIREGTAQKHVERGSIPAKAAAAYITAARATGADISWLLTGQGKQPKKVSGIVQRNVIDRTQSAVSSSRTAAIVHSVPAIGWDMTGIMPLLETRAGDAYFMLTNKVADELPRPASHSPQADIFAIYLQSDDMDPRYERGDRLLVNKSMPIVPDRDVLLLTEKDDQGHQRGVVRRLLAIRPDGYEVRSYNPPKVEVLSMTDWPFIYRVEASRGR